MRRLADATQARLDRSLTGWPHAAAVRGFIAAVVWQRSHAMGERSPTDAAGVEDAALTDALRLVEDAASGSTGHERGVTELAGQPALLSAFFQNLDLLPAERDPQVDAIAMMVGAAVHRLAETLDRASDAH